MSSGSCGTWSRNSSISCAVVPTTSGIAGSAARCAGAVQEVAVDPGMERHHADLRQRGLDRLLLRREQRVDRSVAQVVDAAAPGGVEELLPDPGRRVAASSVPAAAPLCRIAPATGRSPAPCPNGDRWRAGARWRPTPPTPPSARSGRDHRRTRATLARNHSTAARRSRSARFDGTPSAASQPERAEAVVESDDDHVVGREPRAVVRRQRRGTDAVAPARYPHQDRTRALERRACRSRR